MISGGFTNSMSATESGTMPRATLGFLSSMSFHLYEPDRRLSRRVVKS